MVTDLFSIYYPYPWPATRFFTLTYPGSAGTRVAWVPGQHTELFMGMNADMYMKERRKNTDMDETVWVSVR